MHKPQKIIFTIDFLFHPADRSVYHYWSINLFAQCIKSATGIEIRELKSLGFSREHFYSLSDIYDIHYLYYAYDVSKIQQASIDYLNSFIDENTLIIGCELGIDLRVILDKLNITFLNFWFHSYKLFDDLFFMINTNNAGIFNKLQSYKIHQERFYFYANYWKIFIQEQCVLNEDALEDNSIVFVGQRSEDQSVCKDSIYLNITHFKEKIDEYAEHYSKMYFVPHPSELYNREVDSFIEKHAFIEKLQDIPTYYLLTSNKIKKVVGISSSVLYEAQYFDKAIEYLYQPLFDIDGDFHLNSFTSIYDDYFNPYFWSDVLSPVLDTDKTVVNKILFYKQDNKVRNIRNAYHGYYALDPMQQLQAKLSDHMLQIENYVNGQFGYISDHMLQIENYVNGQFKYIHDHITNLHNDVANISKKYPKWLIKILSWFISGKENKRRFRGRYTKI